MHSTSLVRFYPTPAKLDSARPNTDCLAASNGVCTKINTAWFGLLLVESKVNNNLQTWPLIHLTSLATFYFKTLLLKWVTYACERNNIMNMKTPTTSMVKKRHRLLSICILAKIEICHFVRLLMLISYLGLIVKGHVLLHSSIIMIGIDKWAWSCFYV